MIPDFLENLGQEVGRAIDEKLTMASSRCDQ